MIKILTNAQKKYLRGLSHAKKPILLIGQNGLNKNVKDELQIIMEHHELFKIKIKADDKAHKQAIINEILTSTNAICVHVIGGVLVIYKAFDEDPKVILPK